MSFSSKHWTTIGGTIIGLAWIGTLSVHQDAKATPPQAASAKSSTAGLEDTLAAIKSELEAIKGRLPDQSHAMKDVGYHFANLWFAGQKSNWPLATFYLDETRSHLKWAVRIIPVRKTKEGDLDLRPILESVDKSLLSQIRAAIDQRDVTAFGQAYRQALEGCYACHKASDKPYLRPHVPEQPEAPIINFDPTSTWPE